MAAKRRSEPVEGSSSKPAKAAKAAKAPAATSDSAPVQALLDAIRKKEKWLVSGLNPPASPAALKTLRALEVPPLVTALYAMHDGTEAEMFGPYTLLSLEEIVSQREMMNKLLAEKPEWSKTGNWNAKWVPFLADGDGQLYCVDPTGSFESGTPGQILFYDHEAGPTREFASFDVLLELLTTLAKKGLLGQEAQEEDQEKYEELVTNAKNVGMPKMSAKELKEAKSMFDSGEGLRWSAEQKLAKALPLARKYPAESYLWGEVVTAARKVEQWPLVAEAAKNHERLTPRGDRPGYHTDALVLALHRQGRDEEALAVLTAALEIPTNGNTGRTGLVPEEADLAFRQRAWVIASERSTALQFRDFDVWWERGLAATDPAERVLAFETILAMCEKKNAAGRARVGKSFKDHAIDGYIEKVKQQLELDRIALLAGEAKVDALLAAAKRFQGGESQELWHLAAKCAVDLACWKQAEKAGAKLIELESYEGTRYEWCRYQVLALHELGRDEEALKVLKKALAPLDEEKGADFLVAVPWREAREAGTLQRKPEDAAFEAKCFALATKVLPENPFAWRWRGALASAPSERKSAFEKVVALSTAELLLIDDYSDEDMAAFRRVRDEAKEQLARG